MLADAARVIAQRCGGTQRNHAVGTLFALNLRRKEVDRDEFSCFPLTSGACAARAYLV
jgi:hypothetical protein